MEVRRVDLALLLSQEVRESQRNAHGVQQHHKSCINLLKKQATEVGLGGNRRGVVGNLSRDPARVVSVLELYSNQIRGLHLQGRKRIGRADHPGSRGIKQQKTHTFLDCCLKAAVFSSQTSHIFAKISKAQNNRLAINTPNDKFRPCSWMTFLSFRGDRSQTAAKTSERVKAFSSEPWCSKSSLTWKLKWSGWSQEIR